MADLTLTKCDEGYHYARGPVRAVVFRWFDYGLKEWQSRTTTACGPCLTKLRADTRVQEHELRS